MIERRLREKIRKIKVLAVDVDGVLTDGKIVYDSRGQEIKVFDVQDGLGMAFVQRAGLKTAIISARSAAAVKVRARDMKVGRVYQDAYPKQRAFQRMLKDLKVKAGEVCFIGDDLPDVVVLERVGFAVAVRNAAREVKSKAHYITRCRGGHGAVREVAELLLKIQGHWGRIIREYSPE